MAFTLSFTIQPLAPLDFELTCQIFLSGDPAVRVYHNGEFCQVLCIGGELILAKVASRGTVEQPKLAIQLTANKPITVKTKRAAQEAINYIFSLNFDLRAFYKEVQGDPAMAKISQALYGFKFPTTPTRSRGWWMLLLSSKSQSKSHEVSRTR
jgi:DNA-3-methyladenine glycosylase II